MTRFFTPDVNKWKFTDDDRETSEENVLDVPEEAKGFNNKGKKNVTKFSIFKKKAAVLSAASTGRMVTNKQKEETIQRSFSLVNWNLSFTKNCIQALFIVFLLANIFIFAVITISYIQTGMLQFIDTYISEVYAMCRDVIGAYIIKTCLENSFKICFSVLSDYIEQKYVTRLLNDNNENSDSIGNTIIFNGADKADDEEPDDADLLLESANVGKDDDSEDGEKQFWNAEGDDKNIDNSEEG